LNPKIGTMKNWLNYFASVGINVLIVILYFKFIWERDGILGLVAVYAVAIIISIFVFIYREKTLQIDAILGFAGILGMVYALPYKKSWYLMAEIMMIIVAMFSVTHHYFDWKSLDERAEKESE